MKPSSARIASVLDRLLPSPNVDARAYGIPSRERLTSHTPSTHPPKILMLYGSLRDRSYSRLLTFEAARLLESMGAEVRVFNPHGLPQPDTVADEPRCTRTRHSRRAAARAANEMGAALRVI